MSSPTQRTHLQESTGFVLLITLLISRYFIRSPWVKIDDCLWYNNYKMCADFESKFLNNHFLLINDCL